MSHYFKHDETLDHELKSYDVTIKGISLRLFTDRGVFSRDGLDQGSRLLMENIDIEKHVKRVVDMGCGYGPIGLFIAKSYPDIEVTLCDVNERALALSEKNRSENQVVNANIIQSDLFEHIDHDVDMVVANPPIRAGKAVVFRLYEEACQHLSEGGVFYCVIRKKQGAPSSMKKIEQVFGNVTIVAKNKGFWLLLAKKVKND